ncbi:MAG: trypsin-like peptidase domain-containing protein, partial [Pseudomonadota bacterium]
ARIGGGGPAGAAAEDVLILMRRVTGEAAGDDHGQVDDVALKQAVSDLRRALHAARAPLPRAAIVETLKALKSKKLFDHLSLLADAFIARDPDARSAVGSLYAQGLIDSGRLIAAYEVLERARAETEPRGVSSHPELYEIIGLMGRTQKQIYVNHVKTSGDASTAPEHIAEALQRAIAHYGEGARGVAGAPERPMARAHWHWINYVALLTRAKADYRPTPPGEDAEALARRLIEALTRAEGAAADDEDRRWRLASLGEAYLAVRDYDKAAQAFADYTRLAKPFEISSTARQLEEVWRLQASLTGAGAILTNLKEAAARGGDVRLSADERRALSQGLEDADDLAFSAMFRETDTGLGKRMKAFVLRKIIDVCDAVCALQREDRGALRTMGTGFIIDGPALSPALSDGASYLLTNAHVLWDPTLDDRPQRAPLTPANAVAAFENHRFDGRDERYRVARVLWQSPETECDAVLVELERKVAGLTPIQIAPGRPMVEMPLAVIGHPMGGDLTVALPGEVGKRQANLVDFGPKSPARTPLFLHYETATEPGNSGSPVLETDNWDVIGLHHAGFGGRGLLKLGGKPGYNKANEGVFIGSIAALIAAALAGGDQAADATAPDAAAAATAGAPAPSVLGRIFGAPAAPARAGLAFAEDVSLEDVDPDDVPPPEADALLETLAEAELWCPFAERGPSMRLRGPYAHRYPIGAVVHYTAGRFEKGAASARATMRYGAKSHAYFCIGADGAILQPGPLSHWGSHAGRSWRRGLLSDPTQDVYWLSRYLVGIEICGAGKVTRRG